MDTKVTDPESGPEGNVDVDESAEASTVKNPLGFLGLSGSANQ